jgi:ABC-type Fe3+-hydroxamate transport system substrate-binding protein
MKLRREHKMNKNKLLILALLVVTLLLTACTTSIAQVQNDDYLGETISVKGEVTGSISLGELSGYTLSDGEFDVFVASNDIPANGETVRAKGTVKSFLGSNYIDAK